MKTILVLGSSGVIGTALCNTLRKEKYDVIEWDIKNSFTHADIYDREKDEYLLPIDIELFQKEKLPPHKFLSYVV